MRKSWHLDTNKPTSSTICEPVYLLLMLYEISSHSVKPTPQENILLEKNHDSIDFVNVDPV